MKNPTRILTTEEKLEMEAAGVITIDPVSGQEYIQWLELSPAKLANLVVTLAYSRVFGWSCTIIRLEADATFIEGVGWSSVGEPKEYYGYATDAERALDNALDVEKKAAMYASFVEDISHVED